MRCLRFSLFLFIFLALTRCASDYAFLTPSHDDHSCESSLKPKLTGTSWYSASIDVVGHHISGLLLIKQMADSAYRVVFTNEAGITYFDFGFDRDRTFKVYNVIDQLNKKAVITTLKKDFELVIGLPFEGKPVSRYSGNDSVYFGVRQKNETAYFITRKDCASLQGMERGSSRKRVVSVSISGKGYPQPEQFVLVHHTFNMQIKLNRIHKE